MRNSKERTNIIYGLKRKRRIKKKDRLQQQMTAAAKILKNTQDINPQ
jgi:hypothetical protein